MNSSKATTQTGPQQNVIPPPPGIKALATGTSPDQQKQQSGTKGTQPCKFWGTVNGCRRGDGCTYAHSWDGIQKQDRCFVCSAEGHMAKECPTRKEKASGTKKVSKVKGAKESTDGPVEDQQKDEKKGRISQKESQEKPSAKVVDEKKPVDPQPSSRPDPTEAVLSEAAALLKSLRSLKAVKVKQITTPCGGSGQRMALLDGGATHGLREATAEERNRLIPVEVELAAGSATLYRVENHRTLLSLTPVEAIVPLHRIVEMGYRIDWNRKGCRIFHRHRGVIECSLRSGCPVLPEADGLELLKEMEHDDARKERVSREVVSWWRERFPDIPDEVLGYMKGQEDADYDVEQCPWNRRQRRQHLRSRGVVLNLFSGKDTKSWRVFEQKGYTVLHVDIENGSQFDLHRVGTWAYLVGLCRRGRVVAIVGGPPCRSVSRLRHRRPGPRPLRDRGNQRWGFDHLEPWEKDLVNGDTALMFKQIGLWLLADEFKAGSISPFFVLENPQDPADYMEDEALKEQYPSYWCFPEMGWTKERMSGQLISFDQGAMGHRRRKPTTLLVSNAPDIIQLHGVSGDGLGEEKVHSLEEKVKQSRGWAAWSPGLLAAVQKSLEMYLHALPQEGHDGRGCEGGTSSTGTSSEEHPSCRKMDVNAWKAHVRNQHQPYRRDCRRCLELMGVDGKHRRSHGSSSAHCMSVDLVGPMPVGTDVGTETKQKYFMVATVAIPKLPRAVEDDVKEPGETHDEKVQPGEQDEAGAVSGEKDELLELLQALEDQPSADDRERPPDPEVQNLNEKWLEHIKDLADPVGVQNITLAEPVESRNQHDITRVASKLFCRFRAMGLEIHRLHSDRETGFLSRTFQSFCRNMGLYQTMTGGDENPSNGRIEAEVQCIKRRVRLLVRESGLEECYWPGIVRHAGEERMRAQLQKFGVPCKPLLPVGSLVTVKTKRWHKAGHGPLVPPFRTMRLMGPSPLMSTGYVLEADGQVQHARLAVQTDPAADRAVLELQAVDDPGKPRHRLHGKQPRDPMLPQLPRPLQRSDAELLDQLDPPDEREGQLAISAGDRPGGDDRDDPLAELDPDDLYYPESPLPDEPEPALRELRAGGEWIWPLKSGSIENRSLETSERGDVMYQVCHSCGLLQRNGEGVCGICENEVKPKVTRCLAPYAVCSLHHGRDLLQQMHDELWDWKRTWCEELRRVAVGEEDGSIHGQMLEFLEGQVTMREEECVEMNEDETVKVAAMTMACNGGVASTTEGQPSGVHPVLQTYTVPLAQVKKDLEAWKPALEKELNSLVKVTGAIREVRVRDLPKEEGYSTMQTVPSKLVPTIKSPDGRLKARIVLCGNLLEGGKQDSQTEAKSYDLYASGIDGVTLRCSLKKAVEESWDIAMLDITTAFLLAPRCSKTLLVSTPPSILVQAGLIAPDVRWVIEKAVYGLETSPSDWQQHRDKVIRAIRWWSNGRHFWFQQTPEPNLWHIFSAVGCEDSFTPVMESGTRCGTLLAYVDDFMILAEPSVVKETVTKLTEIWKTSKPEWVGSDRWSKFCGLQLRWKGTTLQLSQPDYTRDVLERYPEVRPKQYPLPKLSEDVVEEVINPADVKKCQAVVGELLWLSTKTRPDLSYAVSYLGSRVSKSPKRVLELSEHVLGYLKTTVDFALEYRNSGGLQGELDSTGRCVGENRVEVYSDASFAPNGERSHQGLMAYWKGSLIQWESRAQPFCTLSTTEAELLGYTDAMVLGESVGSVINVIELNTLDDAGGFILRGDNQSGLQLLQAPSGPWRTRHLRLRSNVLRERLQQKLWQVGHVPGSKLMVDLLTKAITLVKTWENFYESAGLVNLGQGTSELPDSEPVQDSSSVKEKIAACAAALCALGSWKPSCSRSTLGRCVSISAVAAMTAQLIKGMKSNSHPTQDLKRARSKETIGPAPASTAAEAPLKGGVEKRKVSRCDELTPQKHLSWENEPGRSIQLKALRSSGPRQVVVPGAEAMADSRPFGPPFDFWPVCDQRFNEPPVGGKDRWLSLANGWWVKIHCEWRRRTFTPAHQNVPFNTLEIEPDRFTTTFWRAADGGWRQQIHHEPWATPTRDVLDRDPRTNRSMQWIGYSFFKMKEEQAVAAGSDGRVGEEGRDFVPRGDEGGPRLRGEASGVFAPRHAGGYGVPQSPGASIDRGPKARARAAGPLILRGSVARCFPGGVLQPVAAERNVAAKARPTTAHPRVVTNPSTGESVPLAAYHDGVTYETPYRAEDRRCAEDRRGAEDLSQGEGERGESEVPESDPVTELGAAVTPTDPYEYMLAHVRDAAEELAWNAGLPIPHEGVPYAGAEDIPPANGVRPRLAALTGDLHGQYFNSGLYVPITPPAFSDTMSEPGEAIERLLSPAAQEHRRRRRVPAHHPDWIPPENGGKGVEIRSQVSETENDDDFELLQ